MSNIKTLLSTNSFLASSFLILVFVSCNLLNNDEIRLFKFKKDKNISNELGEPINTTKWEKTKV